MTTARWTKKAVIERLLAEDMVELAARVECDHHISGGLISVWNSGLTNKDSRRECLRAVLQAVAANLSRQPPPGETEEVG